MSGKAWLWVSWEQPLGDPPDPRPLQFPPEDERILGWWLTGEGEEHFNMCAAILATTDEEAREAVLSGWPEAFSVNPEWRLFTESEGPWDGSDRFILSDWMLPRLAVLEEGGPAPRAGGVRGREAGKDGEQDEAH